MTKPFFFFVGWVWVVVVRRLGATYSSARCGFSEYICDLWRWAGQGAYRARPRHP